MLLSTVTVTIAMPPRFPLHLAQTTQGWSTNLLPSFLVPFLHQHSRPASILASLSDTAGAYNRKIRRGRGPSSGKGKTSGRGHKGQKQHGKVPTGFQGGQTPDEVVRGKEGFKNVYGSTSMLPSEHPSLFLTFARQSRDRDVAYQP